MLKKNKKIDKESRLCIYGIYTKLIEAIKHYDGIQATLRSLSSTLLLATFVGIGFLFSSQGSDSPIRTLLAVILICTLSIGALTILCFLDLVFQERLSIANLYEALKLEEKHQWLPQIHHYMLDKEAHYSDPSRKAVFYIGCCSCLFVLIGFFLHYFLSNSLTHLLIIISGVIFAILLYSIIIKKITGNLKRFIIEIKKYEGTL